MNDREFARRSELPVSAGEAFRWHTRPGAFQRLVPPWEAVHFTTPAAEIEPGAQQEIALRVGPLPVRWRSEITSVQDGEFFEDVQLAGPFAKWVHRHSLLPAGPERCVLEDRVRYALPLGFLGRLFGGAFVRRDLERMFAYRHRITANDLRRHSTVTDTKKLTVLVTGSTGMVGSALTAFLTTGGHEVRRLVRREPKTEHEYRWDPSKAALDQKAVEGADAIVHLAGENIAAGRWTAAQKERILRSRVDGTRLIARAVSSASAKPSVLVSASAIGFYGNRGDEILDERATEGKGFLAEVCRAWEAAAREAEGVRRVQLRFGVILSPAGGALKKMLLPFKLGAGGRIGSGKQWMSWVALDDVVGAIHHAIATASLNGPVNCVAPNAVTNSQFTRVLGKVLHRPALLPAPAFAMRLALGEMAEELLLASQRVVPRALRESGFQFTYPVLDAALRHELGMQR